MAQIKPLVFSLFAIISCFVQPTVGLYDCSSGLRNGRLIQNKTYRGCYHEGQGVLAATVNVTHPYVFPIFRKCYVELWNVNGALLTAPWEQASDLL
jgi:hypothetical protein